MDLYLDIDKKLNDFRLQIRYSGSASRIGILGASGCGKSMTLKSIAGIEKPDQGRIVLGDRTLFDASARINLRPQARKVGYLFQNYALFPTMTVEQNIMAGLHGRDIDASGRVQEMIRKFQLEGLEKRRPGELSGGQQQRVALARIMAYRPEAILLDEPFSAMDYFLRERLRLELMDVLREYEGLSVLVTHDRDEAYQLCDYLLLLKDGAVIAEGNTKALFERPGTAEAARLTGCKNVSRIIPLGPHRICAPDWGGLELTTAEEVTDEIAFAGIRAHDFTPLDARTAQQYAREGRNVIPVGNVTVTELPFEWYVTLSCGLWWKLPRDMHDHGFENRIPAALTVDPAAIMLLR